MSVRVKNLGISASPPTKECNDKLCPWHGSLPVRGRIIEGMVKTSKMERSAIIVRDFLHLVSKYDRYERRRGALTVRNPSCIDAKPGDMVKVIECRHLAKSISFVIVEILDIKK
ncbi:MAG: 30S ribosomal protein S17 [Candidatus Heimdallarchaeota archaeon]|nr:30S ribosomal protein S17 [Candidatus Heimdallarchaeota archaeon]